MERAVMGEIEGSNIRTSLFEALKQLIVAGNVLLYLLPQGGMKLFRIDRYVAKRDPAGNVLEMITHETISPMELPEQHPHPEVKAKIEADKKPGHEDTVDVYTQVCARNRWTVRKKSAASTSPVRSAPTRCTSLRGSRCASSPSTARTTGAATSRSTSAT
jgi:hypothetical protein